VERYCAAGSFLGRGIVQLDPSGDPTIRIEQHRPCQLGDLSGPQPSFDRQQDHHAVTLRVPATARSPQSSEHLLARENFRKHAVKTAG
jgi:hypothetical protein